MSRKFEDFLTPSSLCQTKMAVLIRSSYKVSQKIQRPSPFLRNVIYAWSFKQIQNITVRYWALCEPTFQAGSGKELWSGRIYRLWFKLRRINRQLAVYQKFILKKIWWNDPIFVQILESDSSRHDDIDYILIQICQLLLFWSFNLKNVSYLTLIDHFC